MSGPGVWVSESGAGETVVVLHPGGTDSRAMTGLCRELTGNHLILVDRPGHGRSPDTSGAWSFAAMADVVAHVLEDHGISTAHVVGWSDGGVVGLYLTLRWPRLVRSLVVGGAAFHHTGWVEGVLAGDPPSFLADAYGEVSPDGIEHWPIVVRKAHELHGSEPDITVERLRSIVAPTLIVVGDDDHVRWEHLLEMYDSVPNAEFAVIPRATHGLIAEKPGLIAHLIREFHRPGRDNGLAPIRRPGPSVLD